jgi:hypothetical protein
MASDVSYGSVVTDTRQGRKRYRNHRDFSAGYQIRRARVSRNHVDCVAALNEISNPATRNRASSIGDIENLHV